MDFHFPFAFIFPPYFHFGIKHMDFVRKLHLLQFMTTFEWWNYDWLCNYFVKHSIIKKNEHIHNVKTLFENPWSEANTFGWNKKRNIDEPIKIDLLNKNADWICKFIELIFHRCWHFVMDITKMIEKYVNDVYIHKY